jgi:hypothetical protein
MALTTTTASVAIAAADQAITVASATGFLAGKLVKVDAEFMQVRQDYSAGLVIPVLRGREGTFGAAHAITSNVVVGSGSDFAGGVPQATEAYPYTRVRQTASYNAAGAIALPTPGNDMVAIIVGTVARALTVANPTTDQDGDILIIVGNGKAAHTVTYTAGLGNAGSAYDVLTFIVGSQQSVMLIAANGIWVQLPSLLSGTLTNLLVAIA